MDGVTWGHTCRLIFRVSLITSQGTLKFGEGSLPCGTCSASAGGSGHAGNAVPRRSSQSASPGAASTLPLAAGLGSDLGNREETSCSDGTERRPSKAPRGQACGMRDVSRCVCAHADQRPPIAHAQFLHDVQNDHPPRGCGEASGLGAGGGVVRDVVALRRGDASVRKQGSPHNRPRADATFGHLWFATRVVRKHDHKGQPLSQVTVALRDARRRGGRR